MRSLLFAALAVTLGACSLALDPGHYVGSGSGDGGMDGGGVDGGNGFLCHNDALCMMAGGAGAMSQLCCNSTSCELRAAGYVFRCATPMDCARARADITLFCMTGQLDMSVPDMLVPSDMSVDGGPDAGFCHTPGDCGPNAICNTDGSCRSCDEDGDGFISEDTVCDAFAISGTPRDCEDTSPAAYPGAPTICNDGVENACHRTRTGSPDWDALFVQLGVAEIGDFPPAVVVTPDAPMLNELAVVAAYGTDMTGGAVPRAALAFLAADAAKITVVDIVPAVALDTVNTLAPSGAHGIAAGRSNSRDTVTFVAETASGMTDSFNAGKYNLFSSTGPAPIGATTLGSVIQRIGMAGGFNYADGTMYEPLLFARTTSGTVTSLQSFDVLSGAPVFMNVPGGDMFGMGTVLFGSGNGFVISGAAGSGMPADLAIATMSSGEELPVAPGAPPRGMSRPAIAAATGSNALVTYPSVTLTGGASGFVLVPVDCSPAACTGAIATSAPVEFPTPFGGGTFMSAADMPATTTANPVAVEDFEVAGSTGSHHVVRFFDMTGHQLPMGSAGDAVFALPQIPAGTMVGTFDDTQISTAYATDGSQGVIVAASTFTTSGSHGIVVGGLQICATP